MSIDKNRYSIKNKLRVLKFKPHEFMIGSDTQTAGIYFGELEDEDEDED